MHPALRFCRDLFEATYLGAVPKVVWRIQPGFDFKLDVGREVLAEFNEIGRR